MAARALPTSIGQLTFALSCLVFGAACSDETAQPGAIGSAGNVAGLPSFAGAGGTASAAAGVENAGGGGGLIASGGAVTVSGSGGTAGTGFGGVAGGGGAGGSNPAGGGGSAGMSAGGAAVEPTFACTQLMGPNVAGEWFAAGFEDVVGSAAWQVKAPHHSFVEDWADPNHDVWRDTDCRGIYSNCEIKSPCAQAAPDRLLFVTQQGDYLGTSEPAWESVIQSALATLKAKYPGVVRIELLTFVRAPSPQGCGSETTISPALDAAQQAVAAASAGFVTVGPKLTASACDLFSGPPHMTAAGNTEIAQQLAAHYKR